MQLRIGFMAILAGSGVLLAPATETRAADGAPRADGPQPQEQSAEKLSAMSFAELVSSDTADVVLRPEEVAPLRRRLWDKYRTEQTNNPARLAEHHGAQLRFGSVMRYSCRKVGNKPAAGFPLYIALHGGGGAPSAVNDRGWQHMMTYYLGSVKQGLYVAPRGVANTWNLHFVPDSYPLYDRLIENMILFEDADPNRVYLLGYSAGGDGVYQVTPRMADRFAAANMSAGHHNGVGAWNLCNVPFAVQVGERDTDYGRHQATANFALALDRLRNEYGGGYVHACFVHRDKGHGIVDRDPAEGPQEVIADVPAWLKDGTRTTRRANANAIAWVRRYTRDPWPARVVWDLATRADRSGVKSTGETLWMTPNRGKLFYWLDITGTDNNKLDEKLIDARIDGKTNTITIEKTPPWLRLLLNGSMLDLSKPVNVTVKGQRLSARPRPNLGTMARTLADRGDTNFCFEAEITLEKDGDTWRLK